MTKQEEIFLTASKKGDLQLVKSKLKDSLFSKKVNINCTDDNGWTALMFAADFGYKNIVDTLLSENVDKNMINSKGLSAVQIAAYKCNDEIVDILLKNGATGLTHIVKDEFKRFSFSSRLELHMILNILNKKDTLRHTHEMLSSIGFKVQSDLSGFFHNQILKETGSFLISDSGILGICGNKLNGIIACDYIQRGDKILSAITLIESVSNETGKILFNDFTDEYKY
jgi:hypothetical protein